MTSRAVWQGFALGVVSIAVVGCLGRSASPAPTIGRSIPPIGATSPAPTATPSDGTTPDPAATEPPEPPAGSLLLAPIVEDLDQPVAVASPDDGSGDLYVVEQAGRILRLPGGQGPPEVALDIRDRVGSGGERGLLGLAFHSMIADEGRLFVDYTDKDGDTIIAEYRLADGRIGKSGERIVLKVPQPAANHNGGDLHFGPDGTLYVSFGDGGGGNSANGQRRDTMLGKILRIDVDGPPDKGLGYAIPADNPFVGQAGVRPEIWTTGLRNPWRFSIEPGTGALWIGDVGAAQREEIDYVPQGGLDLGWDRVEGTLCQDPAGCNDADFTPPVVEYTHVEGCVVTGGLAYAGSAIDELAGRYLFADYCSGRISTIDALLGYSSIQSPEPLFDSGRRIVAFGQDADGEVLVVDHGGALLRLVASQ